MFCMGSGLLVVDDVLALEAGHSWAVIGAPLPNVSRFSTEPSTLLSQLKQLTSRVLGVLRSANAKSEPNSTTTSADWTWVEKWKIFTLPVVESLYFRALDLTRGDVHG